ncbi:MAG: hypothetical protein ACYTKD_31715, partial [Planctomycetota bacterium]
MAPHRDAAPRGAGSLITLLVVLCASPALGMGGFGNKAPVIDSLMANPTLVGKGGQVSLVCIAHDEDGAISQYVWTVSPAAGTFPGGAATETTLHPVNTIQWTAPTTPQSFDLTCTVYDDATTPKTAAVTIPVTVADTWGPVIGSLDAAKT